MSQGKAVFQEINGVAITVWSEQHDFAAIGFIVDQIDALISEWYPGEYYKLSYDSYRDRVLRKTADASLLFAREIVPLF